MKERIRDVIDRELIIGKNKTNYVQEFGTVKSDNIYTINEGEHNAATVFVTSLTIETVVFVTVNGVTQALGKDYTNDKYKITFNGVIKDDRVIVVGYLYDKIQSAKNLRKPYLNSFEITPKLGRENIISFAFDITKNDGRNVFWTIHKNGGEEILKNIQGVKMQGDDLSASGVASDGVLLQYQVTTEEADLFQGGDIFFTIIVVYDLTDQPMQDEKLVGSAAYRVEVAALSHMGLHITKGGTGQATTKITTAGDYDHDINYSILPNSYIIDSWELRDEHGVLIAGSALASELSGAVPVSHTFEAGSSSPKYTLTVNEHSLSRTLTASILVSISVPLINARGGWFPNSRLNELADPVSFKTLTEADVWNQNYDYWIQDQFIMPASKGYVELEIPMDTGINDEEINNVGVMVALKNMITCVPLAWGPVNLYISNNLIPPSIYTQHTETGVDAMYNWISFDTGLILDAAMKLKIERID